MASYSSNVTQKINGAVNTTFLGAPTALTAMLTVPAGQRAELNLNVTTTSSVTIYVSGVLLVSPSNTYSGKVHLGPGQSLQIQRSGTPTTNVSVGISGLTYINTP